MELTEAETAEDDGYKKSAGPVVAYVGGLIGFVIAMSIVWFLIGHRGSIPGSVSTSPEEHATTFALNVKGLAKPTATNYVYRVVGPSGATATITYVEQNGTAVTVRDAVLPWSVATATRVAPGTYELPAGSGQLPYVVAHLTSRLASSVRMTCQAIGDGKLNDQETTDASATIVSCGFPY